MAELPMFPLGTALVPGAVLPLQVFEERYRALVRTCLAGDRCFGVVLIERGSEVGGGDVRTDVGTRAHIVEAQELPDGRVALLAVGIERIRVRRWLVDAPYPRADVEPWPDEPDPDAPDAPGPVSEPDPDRPGPYEAAHAAGLGPFDLHRLLCCPTTSERRRLADELIAERAEVLAALRRLDADPDAPPEPPATR